MASDAVSLNVATVRQAASVPSQPLPRAATAELQSVATAGIDSSAQQAVAPDENISSAADLEALAEQLREYVETHQRALNFSVDEESGRMVIKVIDAETEEVVRQIPPKEALALAKMLKEHLDDVALAAGLLLEEKV
jgi:flagellar protein FlaG